jgi:transforming growth factor-beta-induced protein
VKKSFALCLSLLGLSSSLVFGQTCQMQVSQCQVQTISTAVAPQDQDIVDIAVGAGSFNTLVAAVKAAGLVDTLKSAGPFTVFAPTDEAFAKLPEGTVEALLKPENKDQLVAILTYHVVSGKVMAADVQKVKSAKTVQGQSVSVNVVDGKVMIDNATVVAADINASNGVIHVIDSVILPRKDIVDTAIAAGSFKTLVAAVQAAGLVDTLKGEGPFTVFAPTDEAFAKLPAGTVEELVKPENKDKLVAILTYHVVAGNVTSDEVIKLNSAKTVNGSEVTIKVVDGKVMIDNATVVAADVKCGNGVIHVIDSVILPN